MGNLLRQDRRLVTLNDGFVKESPKNPLIIQVSEFQ